MDKEAKLKQFKITSLLKKDMQKDEKAELEDDGSLILRGVASTNSPDLEGDVITRDCIASMKQQAEQLNIHADHIYNMDNVIGNILRVCDTDDSVLKIEFKIMPSYAYTIKEFLDTGINLGLSVGGIIKDYKSDFDDDGNFVGWIIKDIQLLEVSLTPVPANWDTYGTVEAKDEDDVVKAKCLSGACSLIRKDVEKNNKDNKDIMKTEKEETVEMTKEIVKEALQEMKKAEEFKANQVTKDYVSKMLEKATKSIKDDVMKQVTKIVSEKEFDSESFKKELLEEINTEEEFDSESFKKDLLEEINADKIDITAFKESLIKELSETQEPEEEIEEIEEVKEFDAESFKKDLLEEISTAKTVDVDELKKQIHEEVESEILKDLGAKREPESVQNTKNKSEITEGNKIGKFNQRVMSIEDISNEMFSQKTKNNPFKRVYQEIQNSE